MFLNSTYFQYSMSDKDLSRWQIEMPRKFGNYHDKYKMALVSKYDDLYLSSSECQSWYGDSIPQDMCERMYLQNYPDILKCEWIDNSCRSAKNFYQTESCEYNRYNETTCRAVHVVGYPMTRPCSWVSESTETDFWEWCVSGEANMNIEEFDVFNKTIHGVEFVDVDYAGLTCDVLFNKDSCDKAYLPNYPSIKTCMWLNGVNIDPSTKCIIHPHNNFRISRSCESISWKRECESESLSGYPDAKVCQWQSILMTDNKVTMFAQQIEDIFSIWWIAAI